TKTEIVELAKQLREQQFRLRADRMAWFRGEQEFSTRMQKGRENFLNKNYLSAVVDFDRAKDAADSLIAVAQRLRGEISDDLEANMRVESALTAAEEAQAMLDSANVKQEAQVEAELRRFASEAAQSAREERLRSSVIRQRERGTAFFKQSLFARAMREWQAALDDINRFEDPLPNWASEIKIQLENNIKMAGTQLEGDVQQGIRRADALARRGQYVQAIQELNRLLQAQPSDSELRTIEQRINRYQGQLGFDQNYNQGVRFYANKDWQNALDAFERALRIKPNHAQAKKYHEDARQRALATTKTMPPPVRTKFLRGAQFFRAGRYQDALDILQQANKEQPYNKQILDFIDRVLDKIKEQ
ncbi:MAG: tetratricopeptide repeat protein, partial [bacterium]